MNIYYFTKERIIFFLIIITLLFILIYPKFKGNIDDEIKNNQNKIEQLQIKNDSIIGINNKIRQELKNSEGKILLIDKQIQNNEWKIYQLNYQNDLLIEKANKMQISELQEFFDKRYPK